MTSVRRISRRVGLVALVLLAMTVGIELLARLNVKRERDTRDGLADRLYVEARGRGTPVVFLAGLQASTRYWGDAFDLLAGERRLVFVDALGFGQSPWPEARYTREDHLGALRRTLLREGATRRVTLVGHSFGAILAAYYAAQHPEDVKRLCLLGTPVFDSEAEARRRIRRLSFLTSLFSLNPAFARAGCDVLCAFRPLIRRAVPVVRRDLPREVAEDAVLHHWGSIDGTLRNVILTRPVAQALARVGPKTILVHGREDEVTPVDRVRTVAADTGATLVITGSDHHGYLAEDRPVLLGLLQSGSEPSTQEANATGSDRPFARMWGAGAPAGTRPRNP